MRIEISFMAALLVIGTDLVVRAAAQGVEQAIFSTAIEYGLNGIKAATEFLPNTLRLGR